jgi:hypothetical protein
MRARAWSSLQPISSNPPTCDQRHDLKRLRARSPHRDRFRSRAVPISRSLASTTAAWTRWRDSMPAPRVTTTSRSYERMFQDNGSGDGRRRSGEPSGGLSGDEHPVLRLPSPRFSVSRLPASRLLPLPPSATRQLKHFDHPLRVFARVLTDIGENALRSVIVLVSCS